MLCDFSGMTADLESDHKTVSSTVGLRKSEILKLALKHTIQPFLDINSAIL